MRFPSRSAALVAFSLAATAFGFGSCVGNNVGRSEGSCSGNNDCNPGQLCVQGACRHLCERDADCPGGSFECSDSLCKHVANPSCVSDGDCNEPTACQLAGTGRCTVGACSYDAVSFGTSCDDGNPCTTGDACNGIGACVGAPKVCDMPPASTCVSSTEYRSYPTTGTCDLATGNCEYVPTDTDCADCEATCLGRCDGVACDQLNGGCRYNGTCIPTDPATCEYQRRADDALCDASGTDSADGRCNDGSCEAKLLDGETCQQDSACLNGYCRNGVCCDGDCSDACESCLAADTDGIDGRCLPRRAGHICNPAQGECDVAEACNGALRTCPADAVAPAGYACRPSEGACDLTESCDGSSRDCPADAKQTPSFVCRGAGGPCDAVEYCTGTSNACPDDAKQPDSLVCRGSSGICDLAENCTGTSNACPGDAKQPTSTVCRGAAGDCDAPDYCDGVNSGCPSDAKLPAGHICRAARDPCDYADTCDGVSDLCGPDNCVEVCGLTCCGCGAWDEWLGTCTCACMGC